MDTIQLNVNKSIDYSEVGIKNEPTIFENFRQEGWEFYHVNRQMFSSKEIDLIEPTMNVRKIPDMFYGFSRLLVVNKKLDVLLDFNSIDMLNYSSYKERALHLYKDVKNFSDKEYYNNIDKIQINEQEVITNLNTVYFIPSEQKVQFADKWKSPLVDRDDIEHREVEQDWTWSTPYMGTVKNLSESNIWEGTNKKPESKPKFKIVPTKEELPMQRLGQDNPILCYADVRLFDDEFDDSGHTTGNIR